MVSLAESQIPSSQSPCSSSTRIQKSHGRSMRTVRCNLYKDDRNFSLDDIPAAGKSAALSENLTDSVVDFKLRVLAVGIGSSAAASKSASTEDATDLLDLSRDFSECSSFNSDISGELQRLASIIPRSDALQSSPSDLDDLEVQGLGLSSSEIVESTSAVKSLEPAVRACVERLESVAVPVEAKHAAAAKLRLLAKHRSDFRELIGASGAIPVLIPLLRSTDPATQENAVTALLNLSLEETNRIPPPRGAHGPPASVPKK